MRYMIFFFIIFYRLLKCQLNKRAAPANAGIFVSFQQNGDSATAYSNASDLKRESWKTKITYEWRTFDVVLNRRLFYDLHSTSALVNHVLRECERSSKENCSSKISEFNI